MFFHLQVFIYSLFFILGLELTVSEFAQEMITGLIGEHPFTAFFVMAILLAYVFQVARKIGKRKTMTMIPMVLALASLGLLYFIDAPSQKHMFVVLSGAVYYFILLGIYRLRSYEKDQTARGIVAASAFATLFFSYAVCYGIYINFAIPLAFLMVVCFAVTVLISAQFFFLIEAEGKIAWQYSFVLGLVMTQLAWAVTFWPFGYLTTAATMLMFYYVFWDLASTHFLQTVSKKRLVTNLVVIGVLAIMVLASSRWLPAV